MRKILIGLIAFFYLTASAGLVVNFHHCMDQLASVSFFEDKDHDDGNCDQCGMDKAAFSCCHDQVVSYKISDSHQPSGDVQFSPALTIIYTFLIDEFYDPVFKNADLVYLEADKSPPQNLSNKRYRTLRVFRI
ncbi:MAG: HYC_CC_PP family protein [Bacteroidota bacterium]